jgi:hypothetical protein
MRTRDHSYLFLAAVDIRSLPGMCDRSSVRVHNTYSEEEWTMEREATLLFTAIGKKAHFCDSLWKTHRRHCCACQDQFNFYKYTIVI